MSAAVLLPSLETQPRKSPASSPQAVSGRSNHVINSFSVAEEDIWEVQRALIEAGEFDISPYRKLRENLPFNRCMSQLLDLGTFVPPHHSYRQSLTGVLSAKSQSIRFCIPTAETWAPAFPRLFGANPSWELFGQQIFGLSNKNFFDYRDLDHVHFLEWIAISADIVMLRAFFSNNSPTAGAVYESLLAEAGRLRMANLAWILFELRHCLRHNNSSSFDKLEFVRVAVEIGSQSIDSLSIINACLSNRRLLSTTEHNGLMHWKEGLILIAASRCDIAILRALIDAGWVVESEFHGLDQVTRIMNHIYDWDSEQEHSLTIYIDLLFRGGVLKRCPSPRCIGDEPPRVVTDADGFSYITWDELIVICPPTTRQALQTIYMRLFADSGDYISRAMVFTVAQDGATGLRAYLEDRREDDVFLIRAILEVCLLFAAIVNDSVTASVLLEVGVDPYIGLLSNNLGWNRKGTPPWNPSIEAATAGNLEVLTLLLGNINSSSFLDLSPIHELVHCEWFARRTESGMMEGGLRRLKYLRRFYEHAQTRSSKLTVDVTPDEPWDTLYRGQRRFDALELIRRIAHSRGFGGKVDLEIINAGVCCSHTSWLPENKWHLACEVLLMKGLVDAHLEYREEGMDLLHLSIRHHCSFTVVRFLSDKGLKVHSNPGGQDHNSMLHDALLSESPDRSEIVEFLLKKGADCRVSGEGLTILEAALWNWPFGRNSSSEYQRIFERLLDLGATVYQRPRKRLSHWQTLVSLLLKMRASDGLILRVVDAGACFNACGYGYGIQRQNVTPLQRAIIHKRERLARELIRRGADIHAPASPEYGLTALQAACLYDLPIQFLEYVVDVLGVNVDEPPAKIGGYTSLAGAVCGGSLNTVEFLLNHGADVNAMCMFGEMLPVIREDGNRLVRPLDLAVHHGRLDKVELLLKAGGRSRKAGLDGAIGIAVRRGHFAILSILRSWNEKRGRLILEEEALWQKRNPEQALLLTDSEDSSYDSDTDSDDDYDGIEEEEE